MLPRGVREECVALRAAIECCERCLQKIDKELKSALDVLEKEKEAALKDLDSQVRTVPCFPAASVLCAPFDGTHVSAHDVALLIDMCCPAALLLPTVACMLAITSLASLPVPWNVADASAMHELSVEGHALQVDRLSADVLARVLPEGVKL